MMKKSAEPKRFETSLAELEQIVASLEQGDLALDEAMKAFEQGVKLTRICQQILDSAELKIQQLSQNSEGEHLEPFHE